MKEERRDEPKLRFPGFTDSWERCKFATMFDGLQNNTLSRAELNYKSGTVKNVHYGDVLIKFGDYIDASKTNLPYISDDTKADKFKNSFLQNGDIVIADTAEDDTVGKCTEIQGSEGMKLLSGLHTIACRPKMKCGPKFLGYYINSPAYHDQLKPLMQGIKVTSISKSALHDTAMMIPKSIEEQTKIGECLSNLDNIITLHQRKLDSIKEYKKGMLQKMFPKKGENVPEVRFPGFTGDWEQRKYSDVIDLLSGQDFEPSGYNDEGNGIPYMTGASCIENGETVVNRWTETPKCLAYKGDVLLVCKGSGYGAIAKLAQEKAHIARQFMALKSKDVLDNTFNYYLAHSVVSDIKKDARGLIAGIARDAVLNEQIALPSKEEQKRIGEFLARLDNTITLHQRELDKWKELKNGLLQQMFI